MSRPPAATQMCKLSRKRWNLLTHNEQGFFFSLSHMSDFSGRYYNPLLFFFPSLLLLFVLLCPQQHWHFICSGRFIHSLLRVTWPGRVDVKMNRVSSLITILNMIMSWCSKANQSFNTSRIRQISAGVNPCNAEGQESKRFRVGGTYSSLSPVNHSHANQSQVFCEIRYAEEGRYYSLVWGEVIKIKRATCNTAYSEDWITQALKSIF